MGITKLPKQTAESFISAAPDAHRSRGVKKGNKLQITDHRTDLAGEDGRTYAIHEGRPSERGGRARDV
jgi:hypothetical protein